MIARRKSRERRERIGRRLPRSFYARPALEVARELIGKHLVHRRDGSLLSGRIVETEAYIGPEDLACHAAKGLTPRTRVMYGPPGHVYVFFIYGMHNCFNVVCEREGFPAAVLVRALEAGEGIDGSAAINCDGPGKLCAALGITREHNGVDLLDGDLWLEDRGEPAPPVVATPRIGIDYAGEWVASPFRFVDASSRSLSKKLRPADRVGEAAVRASSRKPARKQ